MESSSGKKRDRAMVSVGRADSWASYKLRSSLKRIDQPAGTLVEDLEASESDLSESESEGSRTSRSSARHVSSVMDTFCEGKKKAVSEIGFGGLLNMPLINKEATNAFRENFLYEMMSIEDNKGKVPSIFVHTIED